MSDLQTRDLREIFLYPYLIPSDPGVVFVVIPTYNEADNLPELAAALMSQPVNKLHIVFVDDSSPDGTGELAEGLKLQYPGRIHVIHRPGKDGLGPAYRTGFQYALQQGADYIIQMDADFSHSPDYIPLLLTASKGSDVVLGSRYTSGGQLDPEWSPFRYWLSWWANSMYVRLILGVKVSDATGGFKCWRREALQAVLDQQTGSSGYIFQVEMEYISEILGFKVLEVPIYFADRQKGASKMSLKIKLEAMWRTWYLRWKYRCLRSAVREQSHGFKPS